MGGATLPALSPIHCAALLALLLTTLTTGPTLLINKSCARDQMFNNKFPGGCLMRGSPNFLLQFKTFLWTVLGWQKSFSLNKTERLWSFLQLGTEQQNNCEHTQFSVYNPKLLAGKKWADKITVFTDQCSGVVWWLG